MQQIQLYIQGNRVDMFKDESVVITDTIKDVKDISKVFTEYSQTFEVPATKINNKVFKHYYNDGIQNGFDARIRAAANIELNSLPFRDGFIKLEGVDLIDNKAHTYRITFFGNTVSLKDLLGDDLLSSLGTVPAGKTNILQELSKKANGTALLYNSNDIEDYLTTTQNRTIGGDFYSAPVQVPLITHSQRLFYDSSEDIFNNGNVHYNAVTSSASKHGVKFNELKYALKLSVLIKAIEEKYGLSFSSDFLKGGDTSFSGLYMWLHRKKGAVENLSGVNEAQLDGFTNGSSTAPSSSMNDNSLSLPLYSPPVIGNSTSVRFESNTSSLSSYKISIRKDGIEVSNSGSITSGTLFITSIPVAELNSTSQYTAYIESDSNITFQLLRFVVSQIVQPNILNPPLTFTRIYSSSNLGYANEFIFNITQQIPKMKVIDFLTSIFKMFNLVAYVEDSTMVVKTLDDFYTTQSSNAPYDITKYVDVKSSQIDSALPFREVNFAYKGLKTFLSDRHDKLFNEEWGTEEYNGEQSAILSDGIFKIQVPFEHMKFERLLDVDNPSPPTNIQCGYCVDDNQQSYIGMPVVFYMAEQSLASGSEISFVDIVGTVGGNDNQAIARKPLTNYFLPTNSYLKFNVRYSINFSSETDEFSLLNSPESLFKNYYKNYISGVFAESNRLTTINAYLPLSILLKYTLSDRFIISGKSYKINSIETDFGSGKSSIELLNDIILPSEPPQVVNLIAAENGDNLTAENGNFLQTQ